MVAGDAMPDGMDAVVPLEHEESETAGRVVVVEAVAPGENVDRQGAVAAAGVLFASAGSLLATRQSLRGAPR